jgi:hypothetical protein
LKAILERSIKFDTISRRQAQGLLNRVRSLISEHRRTPEFHQSERNPAYLKLVMLEQALATQLLHRAGCCGKSSTASRPASRTGPTEEKTNTRHH